MEKRTFKMMLFVIIAICVIFVACKKDDDDNEQMLDLGSGTKAVYVLNEGLWSGNNASLTYLDGKVRNNYFQLQNGRGLGDVANDIAKYGSKIYCIVNISSTLEVFDASNGKSIKQIHIKDGDGNGRQPRCITFWENKAYVCNNDGAVLRIDTASYEIEKTVTAGANPDGICAANGKLYVSNSGYGFGTTMSVINIENFEIIKTITVSANPGKVELDSDGNLLLLCKGDYGDVNSCLQKIDVGTDAVVQIYNKKVSDFYINGDYAYAYLSEYNSTTPTFFTLNTKTGQMEDKSFVSDGTKLKNLVYAIAVNPYNEDVYIGSMMKYDEEGEIYCFDKNGKKKFQIEAGFMPSEVIFMGK